MSFVGIDVAGKQLDVAVRPAGLSWQVATDDAGIEPLVTRLRAIAPELVVLAATGGLERRAAVALWAAGLAMVNPRQVGDCARATGQLATTDRLDAATLAHFAEAVRPEARPRPDGEARALTALWTRHRQIVEMISAAQTRWRAAEATLRERIAPHLAWRRQERDDLDQAVATSAVWQAEVGLLRGVPALGRVDRKRIAALVGVAPLTRDSGQRQGRAAVWGGRGAVRAVLSMSTLRATRCRSNSTTTGC